MKNKLVLAAIASIALAAGSANADICAQVAASGNGLTYKFGETIGSIYGKNAQVDRQLWGCYEWAAKDQNSKTPTLCFNLSKSRAAEDDFVVTSLTQIESHCKGL